jgi:hypothetical protein
MACGKLIGLAYINQYIGSMGTLLRMPSIGCAERKLLTSEKYA